MISKSLKASSTKGTILYAGEKDKAELIYANDVFGTPKQIVEQFRQVQSLNTRAEERLKTFHASISLHPNDKGKLTQKQEIELMKSYAKEQGLENNMYVCYKHNDTKHPHYHFIANKINAETGKSTSMSNDRFKNLNFSNEQEKKYNLTIAERSFKNNKEKNKPLTNERVANLKIIVDKNINKSKSMDDFIKNMGKDKVKVIRGRGISYTLDKVNFKGSELGRNYSLQNMENQVREKGKRQDLGMEL